MKPHDTMQVTTQKKKCHFLGTTLLQIKIHTYVTQNPKGQNKGQ